MPGDPSSHRVLVDHGRLSATKREEVRVHIAQLDALDLFVEAEWPESTTTYAAAGRNLPIDFEIDVDAAVKPLSVE
jgi:hypothetical protein